MRISNVDKFNSNSEKVVEAFSNEVRTLLDLHASLSPIDCKRDSIPWFNRDISMALIDLNLSYDVIFQLFRRFRNRASQVIRLAKCDFIHINIVQFRLRETYGVVSDV